MTIPAGIPSDDWGAHFCHGGLPGIFHGRAGWPCNDHGTALHVDDIPWAARQLWAPDAAEKAGKYYLYFPAKDTADVFKIGLAISEQPEGPFVPESEPIPGTYSIGPCRFFRMGINTTFILGGIWGGQLPTVERWSIPLSRRSTY